MKKHQVARCSPDPRRRLVGGVLVAIAALAACGPAAAGDRRRLDPSERQQLRHELREAREERFRGRPERFPGGAPGPARSPDTGPGFAPGHDARDGSRPHPPPGAPGRQRLSPEEREQLRMMLRERRRGRD